MKYVKQADTWHTVDGDAKIVPAELVLPDGGTRRDGRPSLRAHCGRTVHTGTFDAPIHGDDGDHCQGCADAIVE